MLSQSKITLSINHGQTTAGQHLGLVFNQGIIKGKYHCTIDLLFDWFGLVCFENKYKNFSSHTADSKPVKQEVNGTVILPSFSIPCFNSRSGCMCHIHAQQFLIKTTYLHVENSAQFKLSSVRHALPA
jgi:hypothetical protein